MLEGAGDGAGALELDVFGDGDVGSASRARQISTPGHTSRGIPGEEGLSGQDGLGSAPSWGSAPITPMNRSSVMSRDSVDMHDQEI